MENYVFEETRCDFLVTKLRKKIWLKELEMFDAFKSICEKYDLKYYLTDGSLLGAVRHGGFIPWDDDFDVSMPRDEYERFIAVAKDELKYPLMLQTFETDKGIIFGHAKIRNMDTTGIRYDEWIDEHEFCQGIFFDIFPLDNIPDGKLRRKIHYFRAQLYKHIINNGPLYHYSNRKKSFPRKVFHDFCMFLNLFVPPEKFIYKHERICRKYNNKKTELMGPITAFYNMTGVHYRAEYFDETMEVPYEYTTAMIPTKYDAILTMLYGDWHKFVMGSSCHGETFYDPDKSWKEYIHKYEEYKDYNQVL